LIVKLANETCILANVQNFYIDLNRIIQRSRELIKDGHCSAILGLHKNMPVALATMNETDTLYASGNIGGIQEFYVALDHRASGLGPMLFEQVKAHGEHQNWSCI